MIFSGGGTGPGVSADLLKSPFKHHQTPGSFLVRVTKNTVVTPYVALLEGTGDIWLWRDQQASSTMDFLFVV